MRDRIPDVLEALLAGTISYSQAAHLADVVRDPDDMLALEVVARVLPGAPHQTLGALKRATRLVVIAADPEDARARHEKAKADRTIERLPQADAMRELWVTMPAPVEVDLWSALTSAARIGQATLAALGRPDPGLDALRVDALAGAVLGPEHTPWWDKSAAAAAAAVAPVAVDPGGTDAAPTPAPSPVGVPRCSCGGAQVAAIVVDLPTVLGLADNTAHLPCCGAIPGVLGAGA